MDSSLHDLDITLSSKVLFIYPHPDDEAYASATLIKRVVDSEISCRLICLTKGSNSTLKFGNSNKELADIREQEFIKVMKSLSISDYNILDFDDGNLEKTPNVFETIEKEVEVYKPTHIVTYEPGGIYGHPDHIETSNIVTNLQEKYGYTILYATVSPNYKPSKASLSMAKNPDEVKPLKGNVIFSLSPTEFISKVRTLRMYKSQVSIKHNFFHNIMHLLYLRKEHYYKKNTHSTSV